MKKSYIENIKDNEERMRFIRSNYWMDWSNIMDEVRKEKDGETKNRLLDLYEHSMNVQKEANKYDFIDLAKHKNTKNRFIPIKAGLSEIQLFILKIIYGTKNIHLDELALILKPICGWSTVKENLIKLEKMHLIHKLEMELGVVYATLRNGNIIFNDSLNRHSLSDTDISFENEYTYKIANNLVAEEVISEYIKPFINKFKDEDENTSVGYMFMQFIKGYIYYDFLEAINNKDALSKFLVKYKAKNYTEENIKEFMYDANKLKAFYLDIGIEKENIKKVHEEFKLVVRQTQALNELVKEYKIDEAGQKILAKKNNTVGIRNYLAERLLTEDMLGVLQEKMAETSFMRFTDLGQVSSIEAYEYLADYIDDKSTIEDRIVIVSNILHRLDNNFLRFKNSRVNSNLSKAVKAMYKDSADANDVGVLERDLRNTQRYYSSLTGIKSFINKRIKSNSHDTKENMEKRELLAKEIKRVEGLLSTYKDSIAISMYKKKAQRGIQDEAVIQYEDGVNYKTDVDEKYPTFEYLRNISVFIESIDGNTVNVAILNTKAYGMSPEDLFERIYITHSFIKGFDSLLKLNFTIYMHDENMFNSKSFRNETMSTLERKLDAMQFGLYKGLIEVKLINKYYRDKKSFWLDFSKGGK